MPDFADVLRAQASNLTTKGLLKEGLKVDQKLVQLRPADPTAHYNLACRYALLKQPDLALTTLRKAVELGYRDFRYMIQDRDLDSIRKDPRFRDVAAGVRHPVTDRAACPIPPSAPRGCPRPTAPGRPR